LFVIKSNKVNTYFAKALCDCGGEFVFPGIKNHISDVYDSKSNKYKNICNMCNAEIWLDTRYPHTIKYDYSSNEISIP